MNLSQLSFVLGQSRHLAASIAKTNNEWRYLKSLFDEYSNGVRNKAVSEVLLPESFVEIVLEKSNIIFYQKSDNSIWQFEPSSKMAKEITALNVYQRYGGEILERIVERTVVGDDGDDLKIRSILKSPTHHSSGTPNGAP